MTQSPNHPGTVTSLRAVAEPNAFAAPGSETGKGLQYYLADHLGTTQTELNGPGWPVWQGAFTPFGQEIVGGTTQTQMIQPETPDGTNMHYKFTGKERDTESGLDNFGARYFGSSMGRFMSPDWSSDPDTVPYAEFENPQSLNLYSYVRNNPLINTDPDGHDCVVQSRTSNTTENVSVSSGNCDNVNVGDGQTKTYVPGTVTGISVNGGNSIDIGYNSYDGQSSGVTNAASAPIPSNTNLAYNWGNNAQGYQQLGAASRLVNNTTAIAGLAYGAAFFGPSAYVGVAGMIGNTLRAGMTIGGYVMTQHAVEQAEARGVTLDEIEDAVSGVAKGNP